MSSRSSTCRHPDIRKFDGIRSCLACGTTTFESRPAAAASRAESDGIPGQRRTYEYTRLNYELGQEVRLLTIKPGTADEAIRCDIITVNLKDKPKYDALSYTWATEDGDSRLTGLVLCADGSTIQTTANCEAAIRRLRNFGVQRVWIDALCIDQEYVAERNHQVALMEHIYIGASRVFVYIDTQEQSFPLLFRWLNTQPRDNLFPDEQTLPLPELRIQTADFLRMRWFHRVWVIQEVALARIAHLLTSSDHFILDAHTVARLQYLIKSMMVCPAPLRWIPGVGERERPDLWTCLLATRNSGASDPRDKVFAILSLLDSRTRSLIPVNYSLGVAATYAIATVAIIIQRNDLAILSYCSSTVSDHIWQDEDPQKNEGSSWPSWVPKWDSPNLPTLRQVTRQFTRGTPG
jgi:hypothetical protein